MIKKLLLNRLLFLCVLITPGLTNIYGQYTQSITVCPDQATINIGQPNNLSNSGTWTKIGDASFVRFANNNKQTTVTNLDLGVNTLFFASDGSGGNNSTLTSTVTNYKVFAAEMPVICSTGETTTVQLRGSNPGTLGTGTWTLTAGDPANVFIKDPNLYNTEVVLSMPGTYTFKWRVNFSPSINCGGVFTFSEASTTVFVTGPAVNVTGAPSYAICPSPNPGLTLTASTPVAGSTYLWDNGSTSTNRVVSPSSTTTYTVRVTDPGGCITVKKVTVFVNNIFTLTSSAPSYCAGTGGVSITLSGSESGVSYQLRRGGVNDGAAVAGNGAAITWTNKTAGTYTVRATNTNASCTMDMGNITILENPLPAVDIGPDVTGCEGTVFTLTATGANSYLWNTGATTASVNVSPTVTTTYSVVGTINSTGCTASDNITVNINPLPARFSVTGGGDYCQGNPGLSVSLTGSVAGVNYQLLRNGIADGAPVVGTGGVLTWNNKTTGTYTISATNAHCSVLMNGSAVVSEVTLPTVYTLSGPANYCPNTPGVTLTLSGSQVGMNYTLKRGGVSVGTRAGTGAALTWTNITDGVYTVEAVTSSPIACPIDMNGIVTVSVLPVTAVTAGADKTICFGETVQLNASGGSSYSWAPAATLNNPNVWNPVASPSNTTLYTATITDSYGCVYTDDVQVTVRPLPNAVASTSQTICNGDKAILTATDNIIGNNETYFWSNGATKDTIIVSPTTNTTYYVTITDAFGCKNSASTSVTVNQKPGVNAGSDTRVCQGGTITLNGSGDANTWLWSTGATTLSVSVTPSSTTEYILRGTYTATGCFTLDTVKVTVDPLPTPSFTLNGAMNTQFCSNGDLVTLNGTPAGGIFSSSAAGAISGNFFDPKVAGLGNHSITYTYTNANSCTGTTIINVDVVAPPVVSITGLNASYCNTGAPFTVSGSPLQNGSGVFGTWTFSGPAAAVTNNGNGTCTIDPSFITVDGNYTLTYRVANSSGCFNQVSQVFAVRLGPSVNFVGLPAEICQNALPVSLTGNQGAGGNFMGPGITDNNNGTALFNPSALLPGIYSVTFTYTHPVNLCQASIAKTVTVNQIPSVFTVTGGGSYCAGNAGVVVGLSGSGAGIVYELFRNGFSTGITVIGTGAAISFGNQTAGTYTVTARNSVTTCTVPMTGNAIVNMLSGPNDAQVITGNTSVCPASTQTYSIPAIANATDYIWQLPANATITSGNNTPSIEVTFAANAVSGNISVYGQNGCGSGAASVIPVTIRSLPAAAGVITGDATICTNETNVVYSVAAIAHATSYTWTVPSGAVITSGQGTQTIVVNYGAGAVSGNVTVRGVNSCGNGALNTLPVTVTSSPQLTKNAPSGQLSCSVNSVTVSASSSTAGVSWLWTAINGGSITAGNTTPVATVNGAGKYIVTVTEPVNSCISRDTVTVTANMQAPENVNITFTNSGQVTCLVPQVTLSATTTSIFPVSYQWTATAGGNIFSGSNIANAVVDKGGVYEVRVTNLATGCYTTRSITVSEVKTLPDITVTSPDDERISCTKSTVTLSGSSLTSGVSYSWTGPGIVSGGNTTAPVVNATGTYTLTVTAPNGCVSTATVQVLADNSVPTITVDSNPAMLTCTVSSVLLSGSSTTAGAQLLWTGPGIVSGAATQSPVVNQAGVYTLTVTHPLTGCTSTSNVTVIENKTAPSVSFPVLPSAITCAVPNVTITSATSATNKTYAWSTINGTIVGGQTNQDAVVSKSGTYTLTVTDTDNGCVGSNSIQVFDNITPPDAQIAATTGITCAQPSIQLSGSSVTAPVNILWSTTDGNIVSGGNTFNPTINKGGAYLMRITSTVTGCYAVASVLVPENKIKPVISIDKSPAVITCATPTIVLNGTAANSTLLWTGPAGATVTNATSPTPTVNRAGKYYLTATNASGCSSTDSTVVTENLVKPANLTITLPSATITCNNSTITLNGNSTTASATYQWSGMNGGNIISATNTGSVIINAAGEYKMVVTHPSSFCKDSITQIIDQNLSAPVITHPVAPTAITCTQTTSLLNATVTPAASALLWTGPGAISNNAVANPVVNAAGTYTLRATHPVSGCITTSTLVVPENKNLPDISIAVPQPVTCTQPNVLLDATTSLTDFTALWTTTNGTIVGAANTLDIVAGKDGLYTLTLTNNITGCSASQNVLVAANNSLPDIMVDPNPSRLTCSVTKVELYGRSSTPGASLLWTGPGGITGATTERPEVDATGVYTLTVTGNNGCKSTATVTVTDERTIPAVPGILPPAQITCSVKTVNLEISPVPVNTDILWTTSGSGNIINERTSIATVDAPGTYTVTYTNRTSGCTSQNSVIVTENKSVSNAVIVGGPYQISCTNLTLQLEGTTATGISPVWTASAGGRIVSGANTLKPTVDAAGTYTFTVTHPTTGCTTSTDAVVTRSADLPALTIDAFPQDLTCNRTQVTLSGQPAEPGTTFTWTASPGNIVSGGATFNPVVDQPGSYILTVTKTATGCQSTAAIDVKQNITPPQSVIAVPEQFTCNRTQVQLSASSTDAGVAPSWTTSGTGSIRPGDENVWNPVVLTPGTYTLRVTNLSTQCFSVRNVVVTEDKALPNINVDKNPLPLTCTRTQVTLSGNSLTPNAIYLWTGPGNISNPASRTPAVDAVGTYTLRVTNPLNGCTVTDVVTVTNDLTAPQIWVNTTPSILNCGRDTVYLKGNSTTANVSYLWTGPGVISNPAVKDPYVNAPGVYTLTVTSAVNGCTSTLPVTVIRNTTVPAAPLLTPNAACYGAPATALTAIGNNIRWYSNPALGSAYQVHTGNSYTPSGIAAPGDYSFYATQTDPVTQCVSAASQVTYTIRSLPAPPVNTDKIICEGSTDKLLTSSGTNIRWYSSPGGALLASGTYTPAVTAPGVYTYYTTQTNAFGCESAAKDISLTIQPTPARPIVNQTTASVCAGSLNPVFTASGTDLKWYASPSLPAPVKTGGSFTPLETVPGTYSYYVTQTSASGCVSPYETVTLTIRSLPQAFTVVGGGVYCENGNGLVVGLNGSQLNTAYQLILNGTTVVASLNGTGAALNFGLQKAAGNYTVKATDNNACERMMDGGVSIAVNMLPGNAQSITGPVSVCQGAVNLTYSVPVIPNATSYTWTVPGGAVITSGLNTRTITIDYTSAAVTGQVTVYASNACGSGAVSPNHQVIVNPLPAASGNIKYAPGNNLVCLGDSGKIYEVDPIANATSYEWVLPAGATVYAGANSRQIRVRFAANAPTGNQIVRVRGVNSCGAGAYSTAYNIVVNPNPPVYAGIDQNLCTTQTSLQGSAVPAGGTGIWNQIQGYSNITNNSAPNTLITDIPQGVNIFTWRITYNGCSSTDTVRIINNKLDVDAGESLPVCSQSVILRGTVPPAGTNGIWIVGSGSASFVNASQYNTTASGFGYGDNKLYWTVTKNGCESRDSIIITSYRPVNPAAGPDQTICVSQTTLDATAPVYGTGKWSVFSGKATFADLNNPKTLVTDVGKGRNVLLWTVTNFICTLTDTVVITNNELEVNAGYDHVVCENRTTLEATVPPAGASGQWSVLLGSASFLDSRSPNTKVSGLVNGPNKLIWSITRGSCVNTDTITVVCNMPSSANAGPDQFLAGATAILDGNNPIVGTGTWSVISGAANFANANQYNTAVSGLNPGANVLRWTITFNNCSTFDEVTITNGTIERVDAGQDQTICVNYTTLEAARPQYGFGIWTVQKGSANFENNEAYNTKVTNLAPGSNILRWSVIVSGIEFYDTVTIVNNQPTQAITGPKQILCLDSSFLTANIPVQGTGRWTLEGGSGLIQNVTQHNSKVTGLSSGENIFRWTITKGTCVSSALLVITNDKTTIADAGLDQTICDDKTTLIPGPAYIGTGEWSVISGSGKFTNNEVTGLARGQNILRYTIRKNNCSSYDDMVVVSNKPTTASAGLNTIVCVDSLYLSANKANTGIGEVAKWSIMNGSGLIIDSTSNTTMIKRLAQGVNVLRWTINNNGCISYSDVQINYAYVNADAGLDMATCENHIVLNANNPTIGKGEWSVVGGSGSAVFTDPFSPNTEVKNLDQGRNILKWTITNFSCQSTDEVIITNNAPSVSFAGGDQSLCTNTTTLAARQPFVGRGSWSVLSGSGLFADSSAFNSRIYNIGSGTNTYRWTVRNQNCISTDEVVIFNNRPIGTYAGLDQTLCIDSTVLSANQPVVGTGVWSIIKGAGQISNVFNASSPIYKLAPDTNVIRWTVTNKQCVEYQEIRVVNNSPSIPSAGADRILCSDQAVMDGNSPLHGIGEWSVISGSGNFSNRNLYNSEVRGLTLGRNIFRWKITKHGCSLYDDVILTNDLPTRPDAGTDISVCDNNASLNANKPAIGKGYWSIVSGRGTFIDSTQFNTRIVGLGQGSNILTWTTVHNRCVLSDVVEVRNNQTTVYAGPDQVVYENSSILVGNEPLRGVGTWSLNAGGGNISSPNRYETTVTGLAEGINTFLWSVDISGCISSDAIQITYYKLPTASFAISSSEGCPPHTVRFTKTSIDKYPYTWYFGDKAMTSTDENPTFVYDTPGRYSAKLVVIGPDGKPVETIKTITVRELPVANFELVPSKVYIPDEELRCFNYSSGGKDYQWDFGDGSTSSDLNPSHVYQDSGYYTVKLRVTSQYGCVDSMTLERGVQVIETSRVKFPSAFTPNPNGPSGGVYNRFDYSNDVFYPIVITGEIHNYHLQIYNRWGVLLFESKDINIGWDGYYKDRLMMQDIYIYRVSGRLNNGKKINSAGDFMLMRK